MRADSVSKAFMMLAFMLTRCYTFAACHTLTHFDAQGQAHMVDVADKAHTRRVGVAHGVAL